MKDEQKPEPPEKEPQEPLAKYKPRGLVPYELREPALYFELLEKERKS